MGKRRGPRVHGGAIPTMGNSAWVFKVEEIGRGQPAGMFEEGWREELMEPNELLPEKRLLYAILWRTALDLVACRSKDEYQRPNVVKMRAAAVRYIEDDREDRGFSFRWICDQLGLDRERVRKKLYKFMEGVIKGEIVMIPSPKGSRIKMGSAPGMN